MSDAKQSVLRLDQQLAEQTQRADRATTMLQETQTQAARHIDALQQQLRESAAQFKQVTAKLSPRERNAR